MPWVVLIFSSLAVMGVVIDLMTSQHLARFMTSLGEQTVKSEIGATYAFDPTDERKIVGTSSNVFVGRMIAKVGETGGPGSGEPQTQFDVEVLENIKGSLSGTVTVSQTGGNVEYIADRDDPDAGVKKGQKIRQLVVFEGDSLLEPGQEVLLATNHDPETNSYEIVSGPYGKTLINDKQERKELKQERKNLVEKYKKAKENQINPAAGKKVILPEDRPPPDEVLPPNPDVPGEPPRD